jgi:hypothetical protein
MAEEARQITGARSLAKRLSGSLHKACFETSHMNNNSPNRARRIAFILSGATDALLGGILLLIGFGFLPVDVTAYGFQTWHALVLGGILFATGMWFVAYNVSRLEE